jgi:hypothetical protein
MPKTATIRPEDRAIAGHILYYPETGEFRWRSARGGQAAGSPAGSVWRRKGDVRYVIQFNGRGYQANRVAWLIMTGAWPTFQIDHQDTDGLNNRWTNLRQATHAQNIANAKTRKDNVLGLKGVSFHKVKGAFVARIQHNKIRVVLGYFASPEEAHAAYRTASQQYHGEFGRAA